MNDQLSPADRPHLKSTQNPASSSDSISESISESTSTGSVLKLIFLTWPSRALRGLLLVPIRFYRRFLSRLKPFSTCRFSPTCSAYAEEALRTHGVFRSLGLITWRLLRCQPFAKEGYDPVPPARANPPSHRH